jgi:hypothetical protein
LTEISYDFIKAFAGNEGSLKNGEKLARDGSFISLRINKEGDLLFGSCKGSGAKPYNCSVDFSDPAKGPVPRCGCPSRQIPCKHTVGLLCCRHLDLPFEETETPDDIKGKREKSAIRAAASECEAKPKGMTKAKAAAAIKKCKAQLEGLETGERLLRNLAATGLLSVGQDSAGRVETQLKDLGNYYIPGVQASFKELVLALATCNKSQDYTMAVDKMSYIRALLKKAKEHTLNKISDLESFPDDPGLSRHDTLHSAIEEQMGYAWKLTELEEHGLKRTNEEAVQVSFRILTDNAKEQWVDEGTWVSLTDGMIFNTFGYRPFKARKHMIPQDTSFPVICVGDMYIYPGEMNPRARWDAQAPRELMAADLRKIIGFASSDFKAASKKVLSQTKNPLSDKNPVLALAVDGVRKGPGGELAAVDANGNGILLKLDGFSFLLGHMSRSQICGNALICQFSHDLANSLLYATPLALVGEEGIFRFWS